MIQRRRWSERERALVARFVPTVGAIVTKILLLRLGLRRSALAVEAEAKKLRVRPGPNLKGRKR